MISQKKDILAIISEQLNDIVAEGASNQEVEAFFSEVFEDLSVRRAYLKGFLDDPQEYLANNELEAQQISNGPLVGILLTGVFTTFSSGLLMGAIAVAAGLIQYWLRPQQRDEKKSEPRSVAVFEGSNGGELAKFGETIPAIFASVSEDPTGGVQTAGKLIHSRVSTIDGLQTLYVRYCLSHGLIGHLDGGRTLINDQPLSNFASTDIQITGLLGSQTQVCNPSFNFHSQNVSPSNNNISNTRLIDESVTVDIANLNQIEVTETEYSNYTIGGPYQFFHIAQNFTSSVSFRVLSKYTIDSGGTTRFFAYSDTPLYQTGNGKIFRDQAIYYRTTKRVTQLDLNFAVAVYGRTTNSVLTDFATLYQVDIKAYGSTNWASIGNLYFYSKNPSRVLRSITLRNLALNVYDIRITPLPYANGVFTYDMTGTGAFNTFNLTLPYGLSCAVVGQVQSTSISSYQINSYLDQSVARVPDNSAQGGQTLILRSVNEMEGAGSATAVNLPGFCTAEAIIKLSEAINGQVSITWFIGEGIVTRKPKYYTTAEAGSSASQLKYSPGISTGLLPSSLIVRNLDKRKESAVSTVVVNGTFINLQNSIDIELGDRILIFQLGSSCLWPEIYASLIDEPKFGISKIVIGDYYIDWESILFATNWCRGDNEHVQKFCWHGIISQSVELASLNTEQCRKALLQPWRGNGQAGFYPLLTPPISALYNDGNSTNLRLEYATNDQSPINTISVVFLKQEQELVQGSVKFQPQTVVATTWAARKGTVEAVYQSVELRSCTSEAQAVVTAKIFLNIARYSSRVSASLDAKTIESISLKLGHCFRLFTSSTDYNIEQSGVIVEKSTTNPLTFRLDKEFTMVNSISTLGYPTGFYDANADLYAAGVRAGDLVRNRETGAVATITGYSVDGGRSPLLAPIIPADTYYEVADMTVSGLVAFVASGSVAAQPCPFTVAYVAGHIWITLVNGGAFIPEIGDVCGIGSPSLQERIFQAVGIDISTDAENASVNVTGANWDSKLYNYSDITVLTRDSVINEAPI
jgi:hypothetical protein